MAMFRASAAQARGDTDATRQHARTALGLAGPEDYPNLLDALRERGYSAEDVCAIASENLLRVLRRTLPA